MEFSFYRQKTVPKIDDTLTGYDYYYYCNVNLFSFTSPDLQKASFILLFYLVSYIGQAYSRHGATLIGSSSSSRVYSMSMFRIDLLAIIKLLASL